MQFWLNSKSREAHLLGVKWERAEGDAMKALGFRNTEVFRRMFHDGAMSFLEKRQDILAAQKNVGRRRGYSPQGIAALLPLRPHHLQLARQARRAGAPWSATSSRPLGTPPGWMPTGRRWASRWLDKDGRYQVYRDTIGATPFTVIRGISKAARRVWDLMKPDWSEPITSSALTEAYAANPDDLRATLGARFSPDVLAQFVRPLVYRTGRSVFYAPALADGTVNIAMRERVIKAFEAAGGDVVRFAENLHALEGGRGDKAAFVGETLATFQSFYSVLNSIHTEMESAHRRGCPFRPATSWTPAKARSFRPSGWTIIPTTFTPCARLPSLQAYQSAFGRNMEAMRGPRTATWPRPSMSRCGLPISTANWRSKAGTLDKSGRGLREAVRKDAQAEGLNVIVLENAQRNAATLRQAMRQFDAMLTMNSERPVEIQPWAEMVGTLSGLAVSGPATAFTDTIAIFEQPFRKFGFSTEAFRQIGGTVTSLAAQTYGSLLQAVGQTTAAEARYARLLTELGFFDDDATLTLKDKMRAIAGEQTTARNPLLKGAVYGPRAQPRRSCPPARVAPSTAPPSIPR